VNGESLLDVQDLRNSIKVAFGVDSKIEENDIVPFNQVGLRTQIQKMVEEYYVEKEKLFGAEIFGNIQRHVLLDTIDRLWKDHLLAMDHLREGVGLQGYGQKDPLIEYKKQGFGFFQMMMQQITADSIQQLLNVQPAPMEVMQEMMLQAERARLENQQDELLVHSTDSPAVPFVPKKTPQPMTFNRSDSAPLPVEAVPKAGRNDLCPCGSGKKYKKCHGA
jgi:preprotein translocase subunit SecA